MTVATLTSHLSKLGVQEANVNLAGVEPQSRPSLATNSLFLALALGAAGGGVVELLIAFVPEIGGDAPTALRALALAAVPLLILHGYLWRLLQADYRFGLTNVALLVPAVVNVGVNGSLALAGALTPATAFGAWVGGNALSTAVLAWFVLTRLAGFGRPSLSLARRAVTFGVKIHVGKLMELGTLRLDQWILGSISGSRELGLYSIAVSWSEALFSLPTALAIAQRPDLVRAQRRQAGREAALAFRTAAALTLPLALVTALIAPVLCVTVFGDEFRGSIDDLRVLVLGAFGIVALRVLGNALTAQGRPLLETLSITAALVATLVFDILLIPPFGGLGAAIASAVAYTLGGAVVAAVCLRVLGGHARDLIPRYCELMSFARDRFRALRRSGTDTPLSTASAEGDPPGSGP